MRRKGELEVGRSILLPCVPTTVRESGTDRGQSAKTKFLSPQFKLNRTAKRRRKRSQPESVPELVQLSIALSGAETMLSKPDLTVFIERQDLNLQRETVSRMYCTVVQLQSVSEVTPLPTALSGI